MFNRNDVAYHNIKSDKKPGIHYPFSRYLLKKPQGGGVKLSPSLFRIKNISIYPVTNFYSRLGNCIYLQNVKPVTFIHINIIQGNNFPKQHDALNTIFRLFQSYADIKYFRKNKLRWSKFSGIYANLN